MCYLNPSLHALQEFIVRPSLVIMLSFVYNRPNNGLSDSGQK